MARRILHPRLQDDIAATVGASEPGLVGVHFDDDSRTAVVRVAFPTARTSTIRGADPKRPLVVQLTVDSALYTAATAVPRVVILQSSDKDLGAARLEDVHVGFGVLAFFLETRLRRLLELHWSLGRLGVPTDEDRARAAEADAATAATLVRDKGKERVEETPEADEEDDVVAVGESSQSTAAAAAVVDELSAMGFPRKDVVATLAACDGNQQRAIEALLAGDVPGAQPLPLGPTELLVSMGFPLKDAIAALKACDDDVGRAAEYIVGGSAAPSANAGPGAGLKRSWTFGEKDGEADAALAKLVSEGYDVVAASNAIAAAAGDAVMARELLREATANVESDEDEAGPRGRKYARTAQGKGKGKGKGKRQGKGPLFSIGNDGSVSMQRLTSIPVGVEILGDADADVPFLPAFFAYVNSLLRTCGSRCLVCDVELDVARTTDVPVCDAQACNDINTRLDDGASVVAAIKANPVVVDLLINLLYSAASADPGKGLNRGNVGLGNDKNAAKFGGGAAQGQVRALEPFPYGIGFETAQGNQNLEALLDTLDVVPPVERMAQFETDVHLRAMLDELDNRAFALVRWIVRSSRGDIAPLAQEDRFPAMGRNAKACHQFVLTPPPEREAAFNMHIASVPASKLRLYTGERAGRPTYFAWHGSPIGNWHSIVRSGLRGGHVAGLFSAHQSSYSINYMPPASQERNHWPNTSLLGADDRMCAISLVEIADHRGTARLRQNQPGAHAINIAFDSTLVIARFLFVYPKGLPGMQLPGRAPGGMPVYTFGGNRTFDSRHPCPTASSLKAHRVVRRLVLNLPPASDGEEDEESGASNLNE